MAFKTKREKYAYVKGIKKGMNGGKPFGKGEPHQQSRDQTGALCHGNGINIFHRNSCFTQSGFGYRIESDQMFTSRQFRNNATMGRMFGDL